MKRHMIFLFLVVLVPLCFAGTNYTPANNSQYIAGFIDSTNGEDYHILEVECEVNDIDLNVNDESNNVRHQITPSTTGELGLKIGSFQLFASSKNYIFTVAHDKLFHTEYPNVSVDYRLGIRFWLHGNTLKEFSENSNNVNVNNVKTSFGLSNDIVLHSIVIDFSTVITDDEGIILIKKENTGIYFRLANELPSVDGNYQSHVYFLLEAL